MGKKDKGEKKKSKEDIAVSHRFLCLLVFLKNLAA